MKASLSLRSTAVKFARKLIGANTSQSVESFKLTRRLLAAVLLQAIIYRIRLYASLLRFKSARIKGSIIFLDGFQIDGLDAQRQLKPFPVCLNDNRSILKPVLVYIGYMEAMMYLYSFVKELLAGMSTLL